MKVSLVSFRLLYTHCETICFNLGDNIVKCEDSVKLLGLTIENEHISNVCKKLHVSLMLEREQVVTYVN